MLTFVEEIVLLALDDKKGKFVDLPPLALDQALTQLAKADARAAQVMELRYFGGLSVAQVAEVLSVSSRSVERDWQFARAFMHEVLHGD